MPRRRRAAGSTPSRRSHGTWSGSGRSSRPAAKPASAAGHGGNCIGRAIAELWTAAKIIALQMSPRPAVVPALGPAYVPFSANVFVPAAGTAEHLYYLAALLNSRVLWKWHLHHAKRRGVGLEINGHALAGRPSDGSISPTRPIAEPTIGWCTWWRGCWR